MDLAVTTSAAAECKSARLDIISDRLRAVLTEAIHAGLSERAIRTLVNEQLANLLPNIATVSSSQDGE